MSRYYFWNHLTGACLLVLLAFSGCGPVNSKPQIQDAISNGQCNGPNGSAMVSPSGKTTSLSKNQLFIVQSRIRTPLSGTTPEKPKTGDNEIEIRLAQNENLLPSSAQATIRIEYTRLNSLIPRKFTATTTRQVDGVFSSTLSFKRPGVWEVDIHLTDGDLNDDHTLHFIVE